MIRLFWSYASKQTHVSFSMSHFQWEKLHNRVSTRQKHTVSQKENSSQMIQTRDVGITYKTSLSDIVFLFPFHHNHKIYKLFTNYLWIIFFFSDGEPNINYSYSVDLIFTAKFTIFFRIIQIILEFFSGHLFFYFISIFAPLWN